MKLAWLVVLGSALAAAGALADTLRKGERLAGEPAAVSPATLPGFVVSLPGSVNGLAGHVDGRIALLVRQELVLLDVDGAIRVRRALPGAARGLAFGAAESVATELATGSSVLRYGDLYTRVWETEANSRPAAMVSPVAMPAGGFVFARGNLVAFSDGEARETRRLRVAEDYEITHLAVVGNDGVYAFAKRRDLDTALVHLGWGERVTVRAVVHGKAADLKLGPAGAELALDDGSLAHITLAGSITRTTLPGDGYAITAFTDNRAIGIVGGQMVALRREGTQVRSSTPFGAPIARTDAGMIVPRVLTFSAAPREPFWVLTADGILWRSDARELELNRVQKTRCDASAPAFLTALPGRVLIACHNQLVALGGKPGASAAQDADAGASTFAW